MTKYLNAALGIPIDQVYKYFAITCVTAPIFGVIFSMVIFNCIGGYNKSRSHDAVCIFALLACVVACPIPYLSDVNTVFVLLWLVFFFGSIMLAPSVGIMLNQVKPSRRTTANSLATTFYNLLGYLPAPFVFGYFADLKPDQPEYSLRIAIGVILYWSIICLVFMIFAYILILKRKAERKRLNTSTDRISDAMSF